MHKVFSIVILLVAVLSITCSSNAVDTKATDSSSPAGIPSNKFTAADVAKLKWIEGTWRGMNGDKPFYERYTVEETAMVVESLTEDGNVDGEPERFELKTGEFGKGEGDKRSAASEITDTYVQFVPSGAMGGPPRNSFRFTNKRPNGWEALLEWPATADKPARQKVYVMEPWHPAKAAM